MKLLISIDRFFIGITTASFLLVFNNLGWIESTFYVDRVDFIDGSKQLQFGSKRLLID